MNRADHLLEANADYVGGGQHRPLPVRPGRRLAVVTCMDCRIDTFAALGLDLGDAHVVRTAGARVTEDVLRSLTLSTHVMGARVVAVIGHTDCGLYDPDGTLLERLSAVVGHDVSGRDWGTFDDPAGAVLEDCRRLLTWQDRPADLEVAGYLMHVDDGRLEALLPPTRATDPAAVPEV